MKLAWFLAGLSALFGTITVRILDILLLQEPVPLPEVVQAVRDASPWTPAVITAILGGIAAIVTAIGGVIVLIMGLRKDQRIIATAHAADIQQVHTLVNSGNTALLERWSSALERIAALSGDPRDEADARVAAAEVVSKAESTGAALAVKTAEDLKAQRL